MRREGRKKKRADRLANIGAPVVASAPRCSGADPLLCEGDASAFRPSCATKQHFQMARYLQRIRLLGKERWIGWEIDGVGTEIPGLILADDLSEEEILARGVREFSPMPFESFLGMGSVTADSRTAELHEQDIDYRLDALLVGMERLRARGVTSVPRALLLGFFGDDQQLRDPRVQARLQQWQAAGKIELVGDEECYLRIKGRLDTF